MHARAKARLIAELAEGSRRAAKSLDCPRCGAPCLKGDDHDFAAAVVTVDAEALTETGEMLAILDGRATFDLIRASGKTARPGSYELHVRFDEHVHGTPTAGTVHALHRCGTPRGLLF